MLTNLLIYRFVLVNLIFLLGLGYAWDRGLIQWALRADTTGITYAIIGLFVLATFACGQKVIRVSGALNALKRGRVLKEYDTREKAFAKVQWLSDAIAHLATLGLLGTIVGFVIALSAIDVSSLDDASGVKGSVTQMLSGVYIALSTTAVGTILALVHDFNMRILRTAMECYWADRGAA